MDLDISWNVKSYFLGKIRKNVIKLSSAKLAKRVVKVKYKIYYSSVQIKKILQSKWQHVEDVIFICHHILNKIWNAIKFWPVMEDRAPESSHCSR